MRVVLLFLAGLAAGALVRLLWPASAPANLAPPPPPPARAVTSAASTPPPVPSARPRRSPAEQQRIDAILRKAGLYPMSANSPRLSWLYVGVREEWLLKSEEYAEASITAMEGRVDQECAALFIQLRLTPEAEDRLRRTLAEIAYSRNEIMVLTHTRRSQKIPPEVQAMLTESDNELHGRLRAQLGETGFALYEKYSSSLPERAELGAAFLRVSALAAPLTAGQRDALVAARKAEKEGQPSPVYIDAVLSPAQREAFRQWQAGEQVKRTLQELLGK